MSLLGLLAELETVFIVELDSVLMLLDDSTDDALLDDLIIELFLLDALLLDTADDFLLELFAELLIELDFLLELFKLELFTGRLPPR